MVFCNSHKQFSYVDAINPCVVVVCYTIQRVIFKTEIFAREAKFKFQRIKISKITNFKEFCTELVATIIYNYGFINSYECWNYTSSLLRTLGCFEVANTVLLAALIVAEGIASDNRPSGSGRLLDTGLKYP